MKEIVPSPPPVIRNEQQAVQALFARHVVPSYGRFDLVFARGQGSRLWDVNGRSYLDLGGGIAVNCLGHAHPEVTAAMIEQSRTLVHVSNLYYTESQGRLAGQIVRHLAPGKVFFCNSGAEANEGLYKLARKSGHEEGRFEILTALNSFHGRTLAGIAATGQDKVKKGFEPMVSGFRHVPFNDLDAMRHAISPATVAILVEGIQGEGGVTPATPDYLLGLRRLCDEHKLLLLMDGVQCGHFRTGRFQSFQRILEGIPGGEGFLPDGISMAKSLGGGFPIGAFWLREPLGDLLSPGTHGTTYGGNPLGCAVALKIMEIIERDRLADNARLVGEHLKVGLEKLRQQFPSLIRAVRGLGFMLGVELAPDIPGLTVEGKTQAIVFAVKAQDAGLLVIPAGPNVFRLLPALNLTRAEADEGLSILGRLLSD
ncbi:MAG: aspartate aminotransferase family protein [Verrucomicrobia bacterium]|jgi:acetylornithine aminotransferase/acetylornithine/N-succinyldiaminopimelate aminotransferase|nr:aspartate aminotransferase family protein [Verrucomicrobiota bacterium]